MPSVSTAQYIFVEAMTYDDCVEEYTVVNSEDTSDAGENTGEISESLPL